MFSLTLPPPVAVIIIYETNPVSDRQTKSVPFFCSTRHAFRLPVQAAHCWREQSSNPGEDTCDTRKANDHVRSEVLEKESAHQCSKWSHSSCQSKTCPKHLPLHGGRDQPLQQRSFNREIR